jgi:hypothetical protein
VSAPNESREEVAFRIRDVDRLYNAERERALTEYGKSRIPAAPVPMEPR